MLRQQDELRALASELSLSEERERRRLASDLHDHVGQTLAASRVKLGMLGDLLKSEETRAELDRVRELFGQVVEHVRTLTFRMSPPILYELGLDAAVSWLAEQFARHYDIKVEVRCQGTVNHLDERRRVLMYRSISELLRNVAEHAQAKHVMVTMTCDSERLQVAVEDDGKGCNPEKTESITSGRGMFGLMTVRERMRHIGGSYYLSSKPGSGTLISLSMPL